MALFHIPALANWLLEELQSHTQRCEANTANASFCSVCAMMRTLRATLDRSTPVIKPALIQHKLKSIGKTLMYGRQEDAHEFIKLLLDHMEKSYLSFRRATKLDYRSKETTPLNQIFGGYLRQQVICPVCRYVSTTFSHFQDLVLDIRSVSSVDDALNLHFRKETLDSENAYRCERCHKKVSATKRHLIERAPHVLLIQLKRFTMSGGKIGKHINIQRTIDITRFVNSSGGGGAKQGGGGVGGGPYQYRLTSMVIHLGGSQHGGHYTAVAEASNGTMFEFDDSSVRSISLQSALLRNPYILFYEMVRRPKELSAVKQVVRQSSEKVLIRQNSDGISAKPLPTSHSASSVTNGFPHSVAEDGGGGGKAHLPPPLPCHKERERLSFTLKVTQTKSLALDSAGAACKPNKIIIHSHAASTSLLATKNTPPASSTSSLKPSLSSSSSKVVVNSSKPLSSSSSSSTSSSTSSTSKLVLPSSSSSSTSSTSSSSSSSKLVLSSSSTSTNNQKPSVPSTKPTTSMCSTKTVPLSTTTTTKASTSISTTSTTTKSTVPSLVPYPDDSEDSEVDECRRGAKEKPSARMNGVRSAKGERPAGISQRMTNGDVREGEGGAKGRAMVPRALQVVPGSARVKVESGWQVTDAALHSPSEGSGGSGGGGSRAFKVVEQPPSTTKLDPDNQGWTVTVVEKTEEQVEQRQRQRPELEKSLSHDCVLPSQRGGEGAKEGDSTSLLSKASVDSGKSDRSTKSMKLSLFSLFACVSSSRSPESPPAPPPHRDSTNGLPDLTTTATTTTTTITTATTSTTTTDASQAKRGREQEEEPSSPSKKACQDSQSAVRTAPKQDQSPARSAKEDQSPPRKLKSGLMDDQSPCRTSKQGCQADQSQARTSTTSTTTTTTTATTSTTTTSTTATKNGVVSAAMRRPKNCHTEVPKNYPAAKAKNESARSAIDNNHHHHNGTTKDSSSTSTSTSSLSSSSDSDTEEEEEEGEGEGAGRWVEKTKETMGSARLHPTPSVIQWNGTTQHKAKKAGLWDGSRNSSVVDELRRAGNMAYGTEVSTWSGGRSQADQEVEWARREAKKRSAVDLYNEEMDSGKSKKLKGPKKGGWGAASQGPPQTPWNNNNNNNNPFQRLQDSRYTNNNNRNNNNNNNNSNNHHRGSPAHHHHHNNHYHNRYSSPYHHSPHHGAAPHHPQYWEKNNRSWQRNRRPKFHNKKYREKYKHGW